MSLVTQLELCLHFQHSGDTFIQNDLQLQIQSERVRLKGIAQGLKVALVKLELVSFGL